MRRRTPTIGDLIMLIAAALLLISSFLPYLSVNIGFGATSESAWHRDAALVLGPLYLVGIAAGVCLVLEILGSAPAQVGTFSWGQLRTALVWGSTVSMVFNLIDGYPHGLGFYLALVAVLGLLAGNFGPGLLPALAAPLGAATSVPPQPGGWQPPPAGPPPASWQPPPPPGSPPVVPPPTGPTPQSRPPDETLRGGFPGSPGGPPA
ncbi:MAG: hypothetical protein ACYDB7_15840 [Mycobacteriales bacterium]